MPLNLHHILCTVAGEPRILKILAVNGKDAMSIASRTGNDLIHMFTTCPQAH